MLAEQVLAVVKPDMRLISLKGVGEPYGERPGHAPGDLGTVQPGYFDGLCGWLRGARQRNARDTTPRRMFS